MFLNSSAGGANLDPYLIRQADLPSECRQVQGSYPTDQKIALLNDNQTYRVVLPPMIDRHAQSFQCGTQKGTLYYFLYRLPSEADTSELFARGIFSHLTPVPITKSFPNGFVVLSFQEIPPSLAEILDRKIKGKTAPQVTVSSVTPATVSSATATVQSVPVPKISQPAVVISSPIAPIVPVPLPSPVPEASNIPMREDLSPAMTATLLKELDCRAKDLEAEVRETCEFLTAFNKGKEIEPSIPPQSARIGLAYNVSSFGQLNGRFYTALVGSGRPGEVAIVPLPTFTGVEELEIQALMDARRQNQALPASNEMTVRLMNQKRPGSSTLFPTKEVSWVLRLPADRKGFLRREGARWILIIVTGESPEQQTRADVVIAGLY